MPAMIEEVSAITAKGQTTVPKAVRQALGVDYGGKIAFRVSEGGVTVVRAEEAEDPALGAFLGFLAEDIKARPEQLQALPEALAERVAALADGMNGDPASAIDGPVDL